MLPVSVHGAFGVPIKAEVETLDDLISKMKMPWPDYIKLDLQGAELLALKGAARSLQNASAVQMEVSFISLYHGCPIMGDVIPFMSERGFRLYDIFGLWHRPLDGALAQGDFLFIRAGHPLVADNRWSTDASWM